MVDTAGYWCGNGEGHRCGYCGNEKTSLSTGYYLSFTSALRYNELINRGWRRSGMYMYKPALDKTCCPQYTIKCDAMKFSISKSQKKAVNCLNEYLEKSSIGTAPTKDTTKYRVDMHSESETKMCLEPKIRNGSAVFAESGGMSISSSDVIGSRQEQPAPPVVGNPQNLKTGAQLAKSLKKRDFRRLRALKKIAAARNANWEVLDVGELGKQPSPPSLADR